MKHSLKISFMALVAMFAFSTVADAQLGGLLKKAKQAVGVEKKETAAERATRISQESQKARQDAEAAKANEKHPVTVYNFKFKDNMTIENFWPSRKPYTKEQIFNREKSFSNKEMKKKIVEAYLDNEKINNRKRAANDLLKDRKVVEVIFVDDNWVDYSSAKEKRYLNFLVITEVNQGFTVCEENRVFQKYLGAGTYSDVLTLADIPEEHLVVDWEHKDNADPMAGL